MIVFCLITIGLLIILLFHNSSTQNRENIQQQNKIMSLQSENRRLIDAAENAKKAVSILESEVTRLKAELSSTQKIHSNLVRSSTVSKNEMQNKLKAKEEEFLKLAITTNQLRTDYEHYKNLHDTREKELRSFIESNVKKYPFLAGVIADYLTYDIKILAQSLDWGHDVARAKKVASILEIRRNAQERIAESRVAVYQLAYLLQLYPALEDVIETDFSELDITSTNPPDYDPIRNYLSKEEWNSLSESEKNQRALDNYVSSHSKSNWQIGRDYELSVGYEYLQKGFSVEFFGENKGLEDLGRDLICKDKQRTLIVQCKYWSQAKIIHEKHIFQLYGTTVSYCIENKLPRNSVDAVFVTNTSLSTTAKQVAAYLGILYVEQRELKEFPRIKCNIGKDEYGLTTKIYHLPMDQQYDIVKLHNNGSRLVFTVAEAERLGFRRAYRWRGGA